MYLTAIAQNDTAALIAKWVRENAVGYEAAVTDVDRPSYYATAVVTITKIGSTTSTAEVAVHHNRIVYASELGAHISYLTTPKDADRIVGGFLSLEEN